MASPLQQFLLCREDGPRASAVKINKKQNLVFVDMVRLQIGPYIKDHKRSDIFT